MTESKSMFLSVGSKGEIAELTGGHTKATQLRVLRRNGIRHYITASGWPIVPRSAIDGAVTQLEPPKPSWVPNKSRL